jgi:hypothetical protein
VPDDDGFCHCRPGVRLAIVRPTSACLGGTGHAGRPFRRRGTRVAPGRRPRPYYLTDYYRPHPVVLARLSHLNRAALRDLLSVSWRLAVGRRAR